MSFARRVQDYSSTNAEPGAQGPDRVLVNGRIRTVDPQNPWAQAVVIRHGRFHRVGTTKQALEAAGRNALVVDLEGRFAMPGLYDMHTHPDLALGPSYADHLRVGIENPSPAELREAIEAYADAHPGDGWIYGSHWVRYTFRRDGLEPGRAWLDSFMPDRPVALLDRMWGTMMVNSRALEAAGIERHTADPPHGYLERDTLTGEPLGLLIDGAYAMVHAAMPPLPDDVLHRAYRDAVHFQSANGVVGAKYVHVCENRLNALRRLDRDGELTLRVEAAISWQDDIFPVRRRWELMAGERHWYRSARLSADAVKFHLDGTVEPRSSFLLTPWRTSEPWRGKLNMTPEHLESMLVDMDRRGVRVIAHCTGDAASDLFLDCVAAARRKNGTPGVRHQCAHSTILHDNNLQRFAALDVTAEFSPVAWYPSEYASGARTGYGEERLQRAYNVAGVLRAGGNAVIGTDWPVSPINPWIALETLVTRRNPWSGSPETFWGEPITLEQAIEVMTINGARAMGIEQGAGSIEPGKSADLIVLDRNPFDSPPQGNIHKTRVEMTLVEGNPVFDRLTGGEGAVWSTPPPELE